MTMSNPESPFHPEDDKETADAADRALLSGHILNGGSSTLEIPTSLEISRIIKENDLYVSTEQGKITKGTEEIMPIGIVQEVELPTSRLRRLVQQVADTVLPRRFQFLGVLYFSDLHASERYPDHFGEDEWLLRVFGKGNDLKLKGLADQISTTLNHPIRLRLAGLDDRFVRSYFRG